VGSTVAQVEERPKLPVAEPVEERLISPLAADSLDVQVALAAETNR
jgi:hypothetical protein